MHIAHSNINKSKKSQKRESVRVWVMRQYQADEKAALKEFADRIAEIRKHYPDFK